MPVPVYLNTEKSSALNFCLHQHTCANTSIATLFSELRLNIQPKLLLFLLHLFPQGSRLLAPLLACCTVPFLFPQPCLPSVGEEDCWASPEHFLAVKKGDAEAAMTISLCSHDHLLVQP